jgi:Putative prokaryotic signal transducing protein
VEFAKAQLRRHLRGPTSSGGSTAQLPGGAAYRQHGGMRAIATSNDPVRLSFLTALLADAGIAAVLLDQYTSAVEGSIGAIPRRLMVADEDFSRAQLVLRQAGEG